MPSEAITAMSHATEKVGAEIEVVENVRREIADYDNVVAEARRETEDQQSMTLREGLRRYPKAAAWSILLSTSIIMEGFDVVLLGSFYALPQFNKKYGVQLPDGKYTVTAAWQAGLSCVLCSLLLSLLH
jgi:SP family general alpha glucoside:H+ symporter-like MFS transporter